MDFVSLCIVAALVVGTAALLELCAKLGSGS
jgi:hypothetical protein